MIVGPVDEPLLAFAFERALELDPEGRAGLLDEVSRTSPPTALALEELLAAHAGGASALDEELEIQGALDEPAAPRRLPSDHLVGADFAGFRVLSHVGSGGMGDVYEAEQGRPRRRVALKVLADERRSLERFEVEAQALARLDHANIARVFGVGTAELAGRRHSWMAVEFIDRAETVLRFAELLQLDLRARVELFVPICRAIHHAHQKSVLHRDLKPANLLVTTAGPPTPKVIDFGLARLTDPLEKGAQERTRHGELLGTLRYMSPEQCSGDPAAIDVRTDVYGLAATLFELITGHLPYDLEGATLIQILEMIRTAPARSAAQLASDVDPDLASILDHALQKHPDDRYGTASELADDLERWLASEEITARPASLAHRLRLFARRRRGLFLTVTLGGAAALAAILAISLLFFDNRSKLRRLEASQRLAAQRESEVIDQRQRLADLSSVIGGVEVELTSKIVSGARLDTAAALSQEEQRAVVDRAVRQLRVLHDELESDDASTRALAEAFQKVGRLVGSEWGASPEDAQRSVAAYTESAALWRRIVSEEPRDSVARAGLFRCLVAGADGCRKVSEAARGRAMADEAVALARRAVADEGESYPAFLDLIDALTARGDLHIEAPPFEQGYMDALETLSLVERLEELGCDRWSMLEQRSWAQLRLGHWLRRVADDAEAGLLAHREATRIRIELLERAAGDPDATGLKHEALQLYHVFVWNELTYARRQGRDSEARATLRQVTDVFLAARAAARDRGPLYDGALGAASSVVCMWMDACDDDERRERVDAELREAWLEATSATRAAQLAVAEAFFGWTGESQAPSVEFRAWLASTFSSDGRLLRAINGEVPVR